MEVFRTIQFGFFPISINTFDTNRQAETLWEMFWKVRGLLVYSLSNYEQMKLPVT